MRGGTIAPAVRACSPRSSRARRWRARARPARTNKAGYCIFKAASAAGVGPAIFHYLLVNACGERGEVETSVNARVVVSQASRDSTTRQFQQTLVVVVVHMCCGTRRALCTTARGANSTRLTRGKNMPPTRQKRDRRTRTQEECLQNKALKSESVRKILRRTRAHVTKRLPDDVQEVVDVTSDDDPTKMMKNWCSDNLDSIKASLKLYSQITGTRFVLLTDANSLMPNATDGNFSVSFFESRYHDRNDSKSNKNWEKMKAFYELVHLGEEDEEEEDGEEDEEEDEEDEEDEE